MLESILTHYDSPADTSYGTTMVMDREGTCNIVTYDITVMYSPDLFFVFSSSFLDHLWCVLRQAAHPSSPNESGGKSDATQRNLVNFQNKTTSVEFRWTKKKGGNLCLTPAYPASGSQTNINIALLF